MATRRTLGVKDSEMQSSDWARPRSWRVAARTMRAKRRRRTKRAGTRGLIAFGKRATNVGWSARVGRRDGRGWEW